ncbi:efflux RND transporter periplasmic adaptor subunit [Bacillus benzoevorans]|uniref:HlyD family secretion protein n=1 Tax=Bacillus benzoevorans TaxID=1456 RepID=A0A7X0HVD4_9BACI|nr:efflux RND transporter periplasmic adaptor subunit [Bacillus benzoevorans]MBB6446345.1 HlyD family secretion protein [Bacillus benzoevorans]
MKKKVWIALGVALLILVMVGISVYRQAFAEGPVVQTEKVNEEEISSTIMVPGILSLQDEQKVYLSPEMGEIKEILVQEGQQVKKGDVLLKMENAQLDLEVEQNKLAVESGYLKVNQVNKQIEALDKKQKELAKQVGEKEAKEQMSSELEQLNMEKKMADLDLRQTLLQKDSLVKRQGELQVTSKIDGTVLSVDHQVKTAQEGSSQEPVIYCGNLDVMAATGTLSEYDTLKVVAGQRVMLTSDAVPGEKWEGEVLKIGAIPKETSFGTQGDGQMVQYPVTVKVNSEKMPLKPGFQLIMEIETENKKGLVIPIQALSGAGEQSFVYIVKDNKAYRQKVQAGVTSRDKVEIIKGLKTDDIVIVEPGEELTDGMEVRKK